MTAVIVIPSRYGSKRFPGKPLHPIRGISLLERTWLIAKAVKNIDEVYVATDDERIFKHCQSFGGKAVMTAETCENGTERAYEAVSKLPNKPDIVINLQGDAVLTPPWAIQALVDTMTADPAIPLGTTATALTIEQYETLKSKKASGQVGGTLVTFDLNHNALYFSKSMIPFSREQVPGQPAAYRHIGLYGYRMATLER
jgi:3-deoxy-manno-octulosonate cytidylyltransferase (CMP-KDO synthetase)